MSRKLLADEGAVLWGVRHAQGIRWCDSEAEARQGVADSVRTDTSRQYSARGKIRLVRRTLGPIEVIENPYADATLG